MITARAAMVEKMRRLASRDLLAFYQYVWWQPGQLKIGRHTYKLCRRLTQAVEDFLQGKNTYLVINMPFRHGKSDLVSRALPAYFIGRCATSGVAACSSPNVMMSGYGASLIQGFSLKVREIVESEAYQHVFPTVKVDRTKMAVDDWKVENSETHVYAQGLGGSLTGKGGNLLIVDDYCRNRDDAESVTIRDKRCRAGRLALLIPLDVAAARAVWWLSSMTRDSMTFSFASAPGACSFGWIIVGDMVQEV